MHILIAEGPGFIGSHLVEVILAQGHEVTIFDDFNVYYDPAIKRANIASLKDDIRDAVVTPLSV